MTRDQVVLRNEAIIMNDPLHGMTQEKWAKLSPAERERIRDLSGLHPQLKDHTGWRVEVEYPSGEKERFIVSQSTGWRPCSIGLKRRDSSGGYSVSGTIFTSIRRIRKER
jgi:hypothetical protein